MFIYENIRTIRALVRTAGIAYPDVAFLRTMKNGAIYDTSFSQFLRSCDTVSAWVADQTYKLGHRIRVAMLSPNSCQYVSLIVGIMYGGGVSIPMDPQMKEKALCACLNKAEVDIIVYDSSIQLDTDLIRRKCPGICQILSMEQWENQIATVTNPVDIVQITEKDCAAIIFTSGTTGEEKGVMLSHGNLADNAFNRSQNQYNIRVNMLPLHHAFCLSSDVLLSIRYAGTLCFYGDIRNFGDNLLLFDPTILYMVPMMAQSLYNRLCMLSQKTGKKLVELKPQIFGKRLKWVISGGAHLPTELVEKYHDIGIFLCQGYGMTECSPTISTPILDRYDKAGTAGHIVPRCRTRIVDNELQVKSPSVMMGYVNAPELTKQVITEDGWLRTGDIGYVDEEGFLHITGRKKNLIILSNGENVSPEQIEKLLLDYHLVEACLVYGEDTIIVAEVYPNIQYASVNGIVDIPREVARIVQEINSSQPSYKKIMKYLIRKLPFQKTGSNKIIRNQRASKEEVFQLNATAYCMPENEVEKKVYNCIGDILGHQKFGVDMDIFDAGMDSLGCIMLLTALSEQLDMHITLDEVMTARTVQKLSELYQRKTVRSEMDYSPREEYPLTYVQMYFAYTVRNNTTGNVPVLFRLDRNVDLERLKNAIRKLFRIHPILNNRLQLTKKGYINSRDDSRPVDIPIVYLEKADWELIYQNIVRPFKYALDAPLYHIELYAVEDEKYLLFDIAHIISDGTSLGVMLDNMNRLYVGKSVEAEEYTFYDYILDEKYREENDQYTQEAAYFTKLMQGVHIDRSILNCRGKQSLFEGESATFYGKFCCVDSQRICEFSRNHGVSENVIFLTAFNYCISLYSDKDDTISTSIHNGRTDSRWSRISGCLFNTYNFRCTYEPQKTVTEVLQENAEQIMNTMRCQLNCMHADEMFFQFQGDLMDFSQIAGFPAYQMPVRLESLPFHLIVMNNAGIYFYELRYWKKRFEEIQLKQFLQVLDAVLEGMLTAIYIRDLRAYLPKQIFPTEGDLQILNRYGKKQPFGAWGQVYKNQIPTGKLARFLSDGSIDYLEDSGRIVMQEGVAKRNYLDLQKLEQVLCSYAGVKKAQAYTCVGAKNVIVLVVEVETDGTVSQSDLRIFLKEGGMQSLLPTKIIIKE